MPAALRASSRAEVPELTATAYLAPTNRANSCSNFSTHSPPTKWPDSRTACMASCTSSLIEAYWAFRSRKGTRTWIEEAVIVATVLSTSWCATWFGITKRQAFGRELERPAAVRAGHGRVKRSRGGQGELFRANAHPADQPRRIAYEQSKIRHVPDDDRSRADERIAPDGNPAHDGRVGPDRGVGANQSRRKPGPCFLDIRPAINVVRHVEVRIQQSVVLACD